MEFCSANSRVRPRPKPSAGPYEAGRFVGTHLVRPNPHMPGTFRSAVRKARFSPGRKDGMSSYLETEHRFGSAGNIIINRQEGKAWN